MLHADDLADGDERTLEGIGDTIVYLPDPVAVYDATGFDIACASEILWGDDFPSSEPWGLNTCEHADQIDFPPTDMIIPVVVFNRGSDTVTIRLDRR